MSHRRFFVWTNAGDEKLASLDEDKTGRLDTRVFWHCRAVEESRLASVLLRLDSGKLSDSISNYLGWLIVSNRFKDIVQTMVNEDCQWITCGQLVQQRRKVKGYWYLNPL
jgi:hypothetical protein